MDMRTYPFKMYITENNDVALTYALPNAPPQLILYDAYTGKKVLETDYLGSDLDRYVIHNEDLIYYAAPTTSNAAPTLNTLNLTTGKQIRTYYFGEWDKWEPLDVLQLHICLGKEEDIYLCTPNGIYGGKLNQEEFDLLMPASELGYEKGNHVSFFGVGWERDFYLLHGLNYYEVDLYHYTLEQ